MIIVASERTMPIELGSSYLSNNSSMKLMTLREFVLSYIFCQDNGIGYLAQHNLFDQIPQLKKDFYIPDQCSFLLEKDEGKVLLWCCLSEQSASSSSFSFIECSDVLIQSWFGPIGTVSPLHYDAYHNILAQVVGYKFIRLYHPEYSSKIQPMDGKLKNNSSIDLSTSCDELKDVPHYDILLAPGDCLFLPRWWWHYITSVEESTAQQLLGQNPSSVHVATDQSNQIQFSFSINFWWGKRIEAPF
jgi:lysine-specific demethylase 8